MTSPAPHHRILVFAFTLAGVALVAAALLLPLHRDLAGGYLLGWYENYDLPSASMEPLIPSGSIVVSRKVNCMLLEACGLVRDDVIIVVVEKEGNETNWLKQLVGLPGDEVMVHADGSLEVRDSASGDVHQYCQDGGVSSTERELTLGPNELFLLGVNCPRSRDSRWPGFGAVLLEGVRGIAIYRFDGLDLVSLRQSQD